MAYYGIDECGSLGQLASIGGWDDLIKAVDHNLPASSDLRLFVKYGTTPFTQQVAQEVEALAGNTRVDAEVRQHLQGLVKMLRRAHGFLIVSDMD